MTERPGDDRRRRLRHKFAVAQVWMIAGSIVIGILLICLPLNQKLAVGLFFACLAAAVLTSCLEELISGVSGFKNGKNESITRWDSPWQYWSSVAVQVAVVLVFFWIAIRQLLNTISHR